MSCKHTCICFGNWYILTYVCAFVCAYVGGMHNLFFVNWNFFFHVSFFIHSWQAPSQTSFIIVHLLYISVCLAQPDLLHLQSRHSPAGNVALLDQPKPILACFSFWGVAQPNSTPVPIRWVLWSGLTQPINPHPTPSPWANQPVLQSHRMSPQITHRFCPRPSSLTCQLVSRLSLKWPNLYSNTS